MNPKKVSDLDPKLKEVYERVMGTKVPTLNQSVTPPTTTTLTASPKPATPLKTQPIPIAQPPVPPPNVQVFTAKTVATNTVSEEKKGGSGVLSSILIVAGIIFFVIYALFWLRFFNIKLPFTLPF